MICIFAILLLHFPPSAQVYCRLDLKLVQRTSSFFSPMKNRRDILKVFLSRETTLPCNFEICLKLSPLNTWLIFKLCFKMSVIILTTDLELLYKYSMIFVIIFSLGIKWWYHLESMLHYKNWTFVAFCVSLNFRPLIW